jgi:peroxiredoxin Q/BCP
MAADVGTTAPDFTLPGTGGEDYTLSKYRGQPVVLVFYPGDSTAVCTTQLKSYTADFEEFEGVDAQILAISPQDVKSHEGFSSKHGFKFPLLADTDKKVIELYGVRGGKLIPVKRSVFVVGPDGIVRFVDRKVVGATFVSADKLVPVLAAL